MKAFQVSSDLLLTTGIKHKNNHKLVLFLGFLLILLFPNQSIAQCDLVITNPPTICYPASVDLTNPYVTSGSPTGLTLTYWTDSAATIVLISPNNVRVSGTYYIRGEAEDGCFSIRPVVVVIHVAPTLIINGPVLICEFQTADITSPDITAGSSPGLTLTYFTDPIGITPLNNPSSVGSGTYYIKATDHDCGCIVINRIVVIVNPEIVPIFDMIGPLLQNSEAPALPPISNNGVSGSWIPATINTEIPGVFSFTYTPDEGYCSIALTLEIIIEAANGVNPQSNTSEIQIYPNPNNGTFNIEFTTSGLFLSELSVIDITGRVVFNKEYTGTYQYYKSRIQLPVYIPGVYYLRLVTGDEVLYKKVVVR